MHRQHQQQQRLVDKTCTKLLEYPTTDSRRFWRRRIVTRDGKWVVFHFNGNEVNVRIKPAAKPTTVQVATKQDGFTQEVVMLCVWWNFEGVINHFELV